MGLHFAAVSRSELILDVVGDGGSDAEDEFTYIIISLIVHGNGGECCWRVFPCVSSSGDDAAR